MSSWLLINVVYHVIRRNTVQKLLLHTKTTENDEQLIKSHSPQIQEKHFDWNHFRFWADLENIQSNVSVSTFRLSKKKLIHRFYWLLCSVEVLLWIRPEWTYIYKIC
jgi:hypothetical protein